MSSSRPGVATSTSQPRSSSRIWSPKGEPPYATQIFSPVRNANFFDSSWICCASSRVGASASARIATCGGRSAAVGGWQMCVHLAGSVERGDRSSTRNERSLCVVSREPAIPKKEGGLRPPPDACAGAPHCQHRGVSRFRGAWFRRAPIPFLRRRGGARPSPPTPTPTPPRDGATSRSPLRWTRTLA